MDFEQDVYGVLQDNLRLLKISHERGQDVIRHRIVSLRCNINKGEFARYDVASCIRDAFHLYQNLNDLTVSLPTLNVENNFFFIGSDKHLTNAIVNLLAYSYAHKEIGYNSKIWIEGNMIKYHYEGATVPSKDFQNLFTYPVHPSTYRLSSYVGNGIGGLYYLRTVLTSFDGDVYCNTGVRGGIPYTHFTIKLPIA